MEFESKILSKEILYKLYETGKTLSTAESCTSGRIGEVITSVPGASAYYKGGTICYSDEAKTKVLGIDKDLIAEKNAVSEEVAIEMIKGVTKLLGTDYAIATTGFAGPGADPGIPVGTIWIACGTAEDIRTMKLSDDEGRDENLRNATHKALQFFLEFLNEFFPEPTDMNDVPKPEAK
ncbi:MAG: CinA family protein [Prevotella sp.]|jgi:nicotinamide-nucleotide amidase|nr:CinA family protein [Prevotella sp.]MCR5068928.1 CinA family protein [Prevotella sp.]